MALKDTKRAINDLIDHAEDAHKFTALQLDSFAITAMVDKAELLKGNLEAQRDDLQELHDELSEKQQEGEKGQDLQARIEALDEAIDTLDTYVSEMESIRDTLGEIGEGFNIVIDKLNEAGG